MTDKVPSNEDLRNDIVAALREIMKSQNEAPHQRIAAAELLLGLLRS